MFVAQQIAMNPYLAHASRSETLAPEEQKRKALIERPSFFNLS
jgi:hypothetical protein